jgi:small-conductance mechanosensitive channel
MDKIFYTILTVIVSILIYKTLTIILKKSLNIIDNISEKSSINVKVEHQATKTVYRLFQNFILYAVGIISLIVIFKIYNIDLQALLVSAGVAGLVIAIGMQDLIKDIIAGLFILIEKSYLVGDLVEKNGTIGTIESIGIKTTKIRGIDNTLMVIPNNLILPIINRSNNKEKIIFTVNISNKIEIEKVKKGLEDIFSKFDNSDIELVGIVGNTDFSNIYRFKVTESKDYTIIDYREAIIKRIEKINNESTN